MEPPETRYVKTPDGAHIAYQVFGDGPAEIMIVPGWVSNVDQFWIYPDPREFLTELAGFARVAMYDKPGTGASDPLEATPTAELRVEQVAAVMDAAGLGQPTVIGVSEGALLPKSGPWLRRVKQFFGVLLLAVAVWIVAPLFLSGKGETKFTRIESGAELDAKLAAPGKPVMLDFYADWCVSCKEMEHFTFSDPGVKEQLGRMLLLQVDVTANTQEHKALLKRFSLFGPPGIIFFDAQGREIKGLRVIGYQNAERFRKTLALAQAP